MKELPSYDTIWKIIEENAWFDHPSTPSIIKQKEWPIYVEGNGIYIKDIEGKEYIDGTSSAMCNTLGFGNRRVIEAIKEQLDRLHLCMIGHSYVSLLACKRIAQLAPPGLNRVYLTVTGSDAVEASVTYARHYFRTQGKPNHVIISQWLAFHGVGLEAAGATGIARNKANLFRDASGVDAGYYYVPPPYCYRCHYGLEYPQCGIKCAKAIDDAIGYLGQQNVAGFIGELAFGVCGGITAPPEYWTIVREICNKHKILLIADEIITGWGRLGKLWACELFNIIPDIMVTAKGVNGAYLPLSAMIMHDDICKPFLAEDAQIPDLIHTHSFSPTACAAVLAATDVIIEERIWENAAEMGTHLKKRLDDMAQKSKIVGFIHGVGLQQGVEIVEDKKSKEPSANLTNAILKKCLEKGLLIRTAGLSNVICVYPPLIITREQTDKLADILSESVAEVEATRK
ncbi:aspartate aminotransferase family protein [Chloroflexota bacterium]